MNVLFLGRLKDLLNRDVIQHMQFSGTRVADLRRALQQDYPQWRQYFTANMALVSVNQSLAEENTCLHASDEVAFFVPAHCDIKH